MSRQKKSLPPPPNLDPERQALAIRQARAAAYEQEIAAALSKHRCALQTIQVITNGQAGPVEVRVVPLDTPPLPPP